MTVMLMLMMVMTMVEMIMVMIVVVVVMAVVIMVVMTYYSNVSEDDSGENSNSDKMIVANKRSYGVSVNNDQWPPFLLSYDVHLCHLIFVTR